MGGAVGVGVVAEGVLGVCGVAGGVLCVCGFAGGVLGVCGFAGAGCVVLVLYLSYRCHIALVVEGGWLFGSGLVVGVVLVVVGEEVVVGVIVEVVVGLLVWGDD